MGYLPYSGGTLHRRGGAVPGSAGVYDKRELQDVTLGASVPAQLRGEEARRTGTSPYNTKGARLDETRVRWYTVLECAGSGLLAGPSQP